jgi:hypothetical protein
MDVAADNWHVVDVVSDMGVDATTQDVPPGDVCVPDGASCVAGATCFSAIDATAGGTFMGNTCVFSAPNGPASVTGCTLTGGPFAWYQVSYANGGSPWNVSVTPGFNLLYYSWPTGTTCNQTQAVCATQQPLNLSVATQTTVYYFVESATGTCGTFTLSILPAGGG